MQSRLGRGTDYGLYSLMDTSQDFKVKIRIFAVFSISVRGDARIAFTTLRLVLRKIKPQIKVVGGKTFEASFSLHVINYRSSSGSACRSSEPSKLGPKKPSRKADTFSAQVLPCDWLSFVSSDRRFRH